MCPHKLPFAKLERVCVIWLPDRRPPQPMMPSNRLSLRLGQLPHTVLADLAAQLCSESPALQAAAEECMAAHKPLPHEMVERVLLSPDLVTQVLGPLVSEDGAAAAVCSQWLAGWKATNEPRRRLKQVPLDFPEKLSLVSTLSGGLAVRELLTGRLWMAATPDGRLVVTTPTEMVILDRSMRVLQSWTFTDNVYDGLTHNGNTCSVDQSGELCFVVGVGGSMVAANDDSIFSCADAKLLRSTQPSRNDRLVAEYRLEGYNFNGAVLAPGGLLFCVMFDADDTKLDEIIALDAQTLQLRHRFGIGLFYDARQLAVVGDELYVCDAGNHRLQVFSLTGEHRRSVMGKWRSPEQLCCVKDRLYLVEGDRAQEDYDVDINPYRTRIRLPRLGRRILVLSLEGDILQVVTHPTEPTAEFTTICYFDHKLLASYRSEGKYGMLALQGQ